MISEEKFLFLDFDGVLNTPEEAYNCSLNSDLVKMIGNFCQTNKIQVIFSTAWRLNEHYCTVSLLKKLLISHGFPEDVECVGKTPDLSYMLPRGEPGYYKNKRFPLRSYEIRNFLKDNSYIQYYVAIDDIEDLFLPDENLIVTNDLIGVTEKNLEDVLFLFSKQIEKRKKELELDKKLDTQILNDTHLLNKGTQSSLLLMRNKFKKLDIDGKH